MELSYSQNLEDYHLSLAFAGQKTGTYIDVGAGHPIADNVSFWFYERGWQGIVVEPQLELAALYERLRRRDIVVRGLVGRECAKLISTWLIACTGSRRRAKTLRKKLRHSVSGIGPFERL